MKLHPRAIECHLPCGITQCYHHPTQVNTPRLNRSQSWSFFTYPKWMEGWVDLGDQLHTEMVYRPTVLTQQGTAGSWTAVCWSRVRHPNHYTTLPNQLLYCGSFWHDTVCLFVRNLVLNCEHHMCQWMTWRLSQMWSLSMNQLSTGNVYFRLWFLAVAVIILVDKIMIIICALGLCYGLIAGCLTNSGHPLRR